MARALSIHTKRKLDCEDLHAERISRNPLTQFCLSEGALLGTNALLRKSYVLKPPTALPIHSPLVVKALGVETCQSYVANSLVASHDVLHKSPA